ncbi:MAG: hypothetical protein JWR26_4273 [Pedosphaera sp.]|nr:hypothetical protein [Pedosphaera sp.]
MKYLDFLRLIEGGEKAHVDFKIQCDAFDSSSANREAAKAELAKDICAMANNGTKTSYLVIGVSNDGKHFKSVSNASLTDDALQSFCKTAIMPPAKVKLHDCKWTSASQPHAEKRFIVIQIGPHPQNAYFLNQDFNGLRVADPKERYFFKRHEVWIRRGATSDLAAPEEIANLLRRKPAVESIASENNVDYTRLPTEKQLPALLHDCTSCIEEIEGTIVGLNPLVSRTPKRLGAFFTEFRMMVPIRGKKFIFRCRLLSEMVARWELSSIVDCGWQGEHGFLLLVLGTASKSSFHYRPNRHFQDKKWGYFTNISLRPDSWSNVFDGIQKPRRKELPGSTLEGPKITVLTLPKLSSTDSLRSALTSLLEFLASDEAAFECLLHSRNQITTDLKRGLQVEWAKETGKLCRVDGEERKLKRGEFLIPWYSEKIFRRTDKPSRRRIAKQILQLSGE